MARKSIPKSVRNAVWQMYSNDESKMICLCCGVEQINYMNWHCGHIKSVANGGSTTVDNMVPICIGCNLSMGKMNMNDYKMKYGLSPNMQFIRNIINRWPHALRLHCNVKPPYFSYEQLQEYFGNLGNINYLQLFNILVDKNNQCGTIVNAKCGFHIGKMKNWHDYIMSEYRKYETESMDKRSKYCLNYKKCIQSLLVDQHIAMDKLKPYMKRRTTYVEILLANKHTLIMEATKWWFLPVYKISIQIT